MKILKGPICLFPLVLLLLLYSFKLKGQEICGVDEESESRMICEDWLFLNYDPYSPGASYHLPIYVYLLRRSDGSGGISKAHALEAIRLAIPEFTEHNIFPYVACIREYHNDEVFEDVRLTSSLSTPTVPSDGLLVYIASEAPPNNVLGFSDIGLREFWVVFGFSQTELSDTRLFAHEMGHSIGLHHPFFKTSQICNLTPDCPEYAGINSFECDVRGD